MQGGINKVIQIGRLGADPEVSDIGNGIRVANFRIATTEYYKDSKGVKQSSTEWHNVECWRGLAEIAAKYLRKGDMVYIEGKLKNKSFEQKGVKYVTYNIVADILSSIKSKENPGHTAPEESPASSGVESDEIPFTLPNR